MGVCVTLVVFEMLMRNFTQKIKAIRVHRVLSFRWLWGEHVLELVSGKALGDDQLQPFTSFYLPKQDKVAPGLHR